MTDTGPERDGPQGFAEGPASGLADGLGARDPDPILDRLSALHPKAIDLSLDRLLDLLGKLGNPHLSLPPVIHVAGTNGKGSTIAYLRAMHEAAGRRVHVYTSPHLVRFNERIRLSGALIGDDMLSGILEECEAANEGRAITLFEITTAAAFVAFFRVPADLLLLEVGLGGRFDATNVIGPPIATVITPVAMDHQGFLGDTLAKIAFEKAGILKPGVRAMIAPQAPDAAEVIRDRAAAVGAPLWMGGEDWSWSPKPDGVSVRLGNDFIDLPVPGLPGLHQGGNAALAAVTARLSGDRQPISDVDIEAGVAGAVWPARMQRLEAGPLVEGAGAGVSVWLDGGHNVHAAEAIAGMLAGWQSERADARISVIFGTLNNRPPREYLAFLAPHIDRVAAVSIPGEKNAWSAQEIVERTEGLGVPVTACADLDAALTTSVADPRPSHLLICGSLYLAGVVLARNI